MSRKIDQALDLISLVSRSGGIRREYIAIVGGFLRDCVMNKEANDIDIFTSVGPGRIDSIVSSPANSGIFMRDFSSRVRVEYGLQISEVSLRPNVFPLLPRRLQFMHINHNIEFWISRKIDFGLCQIYAHPHGKVIRTPEFIHDLKEKCITLNNPDNTGNYLKHYAKISKKFVGWPLIV